MGDIPMQAFFDFGSSCNLVRKSDARRIGVPIDETCKTCIKGYGLGQTLSMGKITVNLEVDSIQKLVDLLIVPDHLQEVPLLIGQPFTEQSDIVVLKTNKELKFSKQSTKITKVPLWIMESTTIPPQHVANVKVCSKIFYEGDLFVDAAMRFEPGKEYAIPRIVINIGSELQTILPIMNLSGRDLELHGKYPIVRARPCETLNEEFNNDVMRVETEKLKPLEESQLNIGTEDTKVRQKVISLLNEYRGCFSDSAEEMGVSKSGEIEIKLNDEVPFRYRPYRLSEPEKQKVRNIVSELLGAGIIQESNSPYASPLLLVKKKNGQDRMCIDYRKLNMKTIKSRYPLPRIDDQIDKLRSCSVFTTLDLYSGYHQIPVSENSKAFTAFITPDGHYEYSRMPFGLCNAPAVFQRLMNKIFSSCREIVAVYLDDIVIPTRTVDENIENLSKVLQILQKEGLTLNSKKCYFLYSFIDYLGFEINESGVKPGLTKMRQ